MKVNVDHVQELQTLIVGVDLRKRMFLVPISLRKQICCSYVTSAVIRSVLVAAISVMKFVVWTLNTSAFFSVDASLTVDNISVKSLATVETVRIAGKVVLMN